MTTATKTRVRKVTLAKWQLDNELTDTQAAAELGLARNTFVKYRDGDAPIYIRLALAAIVAGLAA